MTSLPDRPDLRQLRIQAKELKRALEAGEQEALGRVLASHPKFSGRPAERMEGWRFTLRDAQATIARELGFDSWRALLTEVEGAPRWDAEASSAIVKRAFDEARAMGHRSCNHLHFLLALLNPPVPTASAEVLADLGLRYDDVRDELEDRSPSRRRKGMGASSTPTFQHLVGASQGLAIGLGAPRITDEHVLLAFAYGDYYAGMSLVSFGLDPDDVVACLRARRIACPRSEPPAASNPPGPGGPWVYFPKEDWSAVTQDLVKFHPPGTARWGTNLSRWKRGYWWAAGEDDIQMEKIVRQAVRDERSVVVVPAEEAGVLEAQRSKPANRSRIGKG